MDSIRIKRGVKAQLPSELPLGELAFCTDTRELYVGMGEDTKPRPVTNTEITEHLAEWQGKYQEVSDQFQTKYEGLEEEYATRLTEVSSQLDNIETEIDGVKQDFKDDFNALNSEIEENKTLTDSEISKLKEIVNTWEAFKNTGGDIGGAINFPFGATIDNITKPITISGNTMYYRENVTNNSGFSHLSRFEDDSLGGKVNQNGIEFRKNYGETSGAFRPMVDNALDLGSSNYKWKDIYLNGINKNTNGYTKLPNGLILQWGFVDMSIDQDSVETQQVTLPVAYSDKILSCFANAMWNHTNNNTGWVDNLITQCSTIAKTNITISVRNLSRTSGLKTYKINWMTLGY